MRSVRTLIDFDDAPVFGFPVAGGVRVGVLVEGPQGWGEFSPPADCDAALAARWLTAAMEPSTVGWPDAVRGRVPVTAARISIGAGPRASDEGAARLAAMRDSLEGGASVRCVVEVGDPVDTAALITRLNGVAGGLELVELTCGSLDDAIAVRRRVDVPLAVDAALLTEAGRHAGAADIAVLRCGPLGGVRRAMRRAEALGLPCVVNLTGQTSIGQAGDVALAAVLPDLPFACGPADRRLADGDIVAEARSLIPAEGYLPAAPMPAGPDPAQLARFTITDHDTVDRWRGLLRRTAELL